MVPLQCHCGQNRQVLLPRSTMQGTSLGIVPRIEVAWLVLANDKNHRVAMLSQRDDAGRTLCCFAGDVAKDLTVCSEVT